jgi:hypothetical protein
MFENNNKTFTHKDRVFEVVITNHDKCLAYPVEEEYKEENCKWFDLDYVNNNLEK